MSIRVRFACGHEQAVDITSAVAPRCFCGESRISRAFARAPKFTGAVTGPYAETKSVEPGIVTLSDAPLVIKES